MCKLALTQATTVTVAIAVRFLETPSRNFTLKNDYSLSIAKEITFCIDYFSTSASTEQIYRSLEFVTRT